MVSSPYLFSVFTISLVILTINFASCAPANSDGYNALEYNMNAAEFLSNNDNLEGKLHHGKHPTDKRDFMSEGILLGKRDYPTEGIMLGKRDFMSEGILLGKRDFMSEGILLGKRDYPTEGIMLGRRDYPTEGIMLGKREYPTEGILLGKRDYPTEGILLGKRNFRFFAPKSSGLANHGFNN